MKKLNIYKASVVKKLVTVAVVLIVTCGLTGCSASVKALTEDENREISRYMADKLLQYDSDYVSSNLVYTDPTQVTKPPAEAVPTEAAVTDPPEVSNIPSAPHETPKANDVEPQILDWNEFFNNEEWSVTYSSFDTYHTYPKNSDVYVIDASKGNELLVLDFDVKNNTDRNIEVNLTKENLEYSLYIGDKKYSPMVAVLENGGLMYLDVKLKPGETGNAELLFEIPDGSDLSDMRLDVSR